MRGGADSNNGFTRIQKVGHVLGFIRSRSAEAGTDDHQIGILQVMPSPHPLLIVRINVLAGLVPRKQNLAFEPMFLRKNLGEHGHAFLRSVLFIPCDQNDGLPLPSFIFSRKVQNLMMLCKTQGKGKGKETGNKECFHG